MFSAEARAAVPPGARFTRLATDPARPLLVGQFPRGPDAQEVLFPKVSKGRYFSIDSFSAQDGKPYAAIGELYLLDEAGQPMDRMGWSVAYVDSEEHEHEDGSANNAIDGDVKTHWHTQWGGAAPNHPHRLILDLGKSRFVSGFRYLPRTGNATSGGRIKDYAVCLSDYLKEEVPAESLLPDKCFIFAYFTDKDRDGLHLAWSMDGYRWNEMNRGISMLKPELSQAKLFRDPCLIRAPDGVFHMVWTANWAGDQIGYANSKDLIHWSEQKAIPVMSDEPATLNCWAPEILWDESRREFFIFWSSAVTNKFRETLQGGTELGNQRLYCTTTKDFETFTPTHLFYDPGFSLIDATIFRVGGQYHLVFKDETTSPAKKNLRQAKADHAQGPYSAAEEPFSPQWVEGPSVFQAGGDYVVYFRFYGGSGRWGVMRSKDFKTWETITERLALPGTVGIHQGSVLEVPRDLIVSLQRGGVLEIGPSPLAAELGIGNWIWTTQVADKQTCRLWHTLDVPADSLVSSASLRITADNGYRLFLDGREVGRGGDFNSLTEFNLTRVLSPGRHVIAVEAFNDALSAGVILGLQVQFSNGRTLELLSDTSWRVVPNDVKNWENISQPQDRWGWATVVAFAGREVWQHPERIIPSPPVLPAIIPFWQREWFLLVLLTACAVVLLVSAWLGLQLAIKTRAGRMLERERARIARDMHDDLGSGLTQLTLQGELILRSSPERSELRNQVDQLCGKARSLLGAMDEIVWVVNPRRDTVNDFVAFICDYTQQFLDVANIRFRLDVPDDLPAAALDLPSRRNLLLAVKEALRNAIRHSGADEVTLAVLVDHEKLKVTISDNGKGFFIADTPEKRDGLRNMQQRVADIGGGCKILSHPGGGCRVMFDLPLHPGRLPDGWISKLAVRLIRQAKKRR